MHDLGQAIQGQKPCHAGPTHCEPSAYNGFGQPELPYGGPPPPRRWPPGHPSRFGGRSERRSPPPHWSAPVNPTTGSPIYDSSLEERPLGGWDTAAPPQQGSSQWGTSSGWARVNNESRPLSPTPVRPLALIAKTFGMLRDSKHHEHLAC